MPEWPVLLEGVTAIAAGQSHSLALLEDGTVVAWGNNYEGQLGSGKRVECAAVEWMCSKVPVPVCTVKELPCKPEHYLKDVVVGGDGVHGLEHRVHLRRRRAFETGRCRSRPAPQDEDDQQAGAACNPMGSDNAASMAPMNTRVSMLRLRTTYRWRPL